jgi:alpha-L-rhamnosidase
MTVDSFEGARWIAREVPRAQRIVRQINRSRIDWAEPGHSLAQTFHAEGPVAAVNLDLSGPRDVDDPFTADVSFAVSLETPDGRIVAQRRFEGPQLVWDYFGALLDVAPPVPPGDYAVVLRSEREAIGWWTADEAAVTSDDGVSPIPVRGTALSGGKPVAGVRTLGVETLPAPNPVFRRVFELADAPASATLSAVALGTGVLRVNGARVGDEALEPAVTDYDRTVLYRSWEVGHLLR